MASVLAIERTLFLKEELLRAATKGRTENVHTRLPDLPFERYSPIRRQLLKLLGAVNRSRSVAGMEPVEVRCSLLGILERIR